MGSMTGDGEGAALAPFTVFADQLAGAGERVGRVRRRLSGVVELGARGVLGEEAGPLAGW